MFLPQIHLMAADQNLGGECVRMDANNKIANHCSPKLKLALQRVLSIWIFLAILLGSLGAIMKFGFFERKILWFTLAGELRQPQKN